MFGLDEWLGGLSGSGSLTLVLVVAMLLGLRHATDPDHMVAVTTLVAGDRQNAARLAARIGACWGAGHAAALTALGLPIVLFGRALPPTVQRLLESLVAAVIVALALRLLLRWRQGWFAPGHHTHRPRSPLTAFGIGLVHGAGGSAGATILMITLTAPSRPSAVVALLLFAGCTALSMAVATGGFGRILGAPRVLAHLGAIAVPLGLASLAFGVCYGAAVWL